MAKKNKQNKQNCGSKETRTNISREQLDEKIKDVARGLYEKKGHVPGHDLDDWLEAEKIVKKSSSRSAKIA